MMDGQFEFHKTDAKFKDLVYAAIYVQQDCCNIALAIHLLLRYSKTRAYQVCVYVCMYNIILAVSICVEAGVPFISRCGYNIYILVYSEYIFGSCAISRQSSLTTV